MGSVQILRLPYFLRLIGDSKLILGVCVSLYGCMSHLSLCGPVMDWRSIQGVACLFPNGCWDRLQPPHDPALDEEGLEDGWVEKLVEWI